MKKEDYSQSSSRDKLSKANDTSFYITVTENRES